MIKIKTEEKDIIVDPYIKDPSGQLVDFDNKVDTRNKTLIAEAIGFEFTDGSRVYKSDMMTGPDGDPVVFIATDGHGDRIVWTARDGTICGARMAGAMAILPEQS